jgi:hypothetical protein
MPRMISLLGAGLVLSGLSLAWRASHVLRKGSTHYGDIHVQGYTRKSGTSVRSYWRTGRNLTKADNYSTKGNVNPYTGKRGTKQWVS